jgi:hypothetical protein
MEVDIFDPGNLTLSDKLVSLRAGKQKKRKPATNLTRPAEIEIVGPFVPAVPLEAFRTAANLSGQALAVFLMTWRECKLARSWTVSLTNKQLIAAGVSKRSKARALTVLERAGLVKVERSNHRSPAVTVIIDPSWGLAASYSV